MKERLYVSMAAVALLAAVTLPVLFPVLTISGGRSGVHQTSHERVARCGTDVMCQSGAACGG